MCRDRVLLNKPYVIPPERHADIHIMKWASASPTFLDNDLKTLNYCRMHLHVTTISELFHIASTQILPYMYDCVRPPWYNTKQYTPIQPRPSAYQIRKVWKPFCDTWIEKIQNEEYQLGSTTGRATHCRPYRQSYQDIDAPDQPIYHWITDSYWLMKQYTDLERPHTHTRLITSKPLQNPCEWLY